MNKKRIISLVLSVLVVLPATAYAKGNNSKDMSNKSQQVQKFNDGTDKDQEKDQENENKGTTSNIIKDIQNAIKGKEHKDEAMQNKDAKKQQIEEFKTAMRAKHEQMTALRVQTKAQRTQIEQKKAQLEAIIEDLNSGKKTLSADMLASLLSAAQNIKLDATKVKATAEINNEVADTQAKVKGKDFNNALASMDKVIAKLQQRLDALKQLNADFDIALAIANQAVVPATTTTDTTTTQTVPTTTTTDTNTTTTVPTTVPTTTTTDSATTATN